MSRWGGLRTVSAVAVSVVVVGAVAVATRDVALVTAVSGFAGTALGLLVSRSTSADLYRSQPSKTHSQPPPAAPPPE